ncbi:hypothetical protein KJS94_05225 [Flavihumibacter rivuli]|uniref:hypothetical protein n=1 Tax=Flavihumibacter rivuli TaxID=2838156 RepID=UPI001BDF5B7E|nr:hypothetical protein [Flavihumibacter rivuli]ULQ57600.1 hypothetical protein KJS94_05225 [Flavihumibacter rivuli]
MEERIHQLERQLRRQQKLILLMILVAPTLLFLAFRKAPKDDVIRTRGIIVVDDAGRERILIGAPVPYAANRVRTDTAKVKASWAKGFSPQYMEWYKNYDHSANGMVILDENGYDRLALGSSVPDPNTGKRIGKSTGLIINDEKGFERSGYGLINVDGQNRMVLGLDRSNGAEGIALAIFEDQTAGLILNDQSKDLFVGNAGKDNFLTGMKDPFFGILLKDSSKIKYHQNISLK